jgi:uncharacterized protein YpmS
MEENRTTRSKPVKLHKVNGWAIAFFVLLALVIGTGVVFVNRVTSIREPKLAVLAQNSQTGQPAATLNSTKEQVNELINTTLEQYQTKDQTYKFYLDKQAVLETTYRFLGLDIPLYVYFEPYKTEDGNIQLKVQSISAGTLSLPTGTILSFLKSSVKLPAFVEVKSKDKMIVIRLDQLKLGDSLSVKANRIDLINDKISFDLYMEK